MKKKSRFVKVASLARALPVGSLTVLVILFLMAIFADLLSPYSYREGDLLGSLMPPFWQKEGSVSHILGTDHLGRDVLSRLIYGSRISLIVGGLAVVVAGTMGTIFAILAGYLGGWIDRILMRMIDTMLSMPYLLMAIVLVAILGPNLMNIVLVLGFMGWAQYARVLRAEVLRIKQGNFVELAVVAGCSRFRIMLVHIFPNMIPTLLVLTTLQVGVAIIAEASLSFLGMGVPQPMPSWGSMLADGKIYITMAWWLSVFPGLAIMATVLSCNLLGDWLRVRLDPALRDMRR